MSHRNRSAPRWSARGTRLVAGVDRGAAVEQWIHVGRTEVARERAELRVLHEVPPPGAKQSSSSARLWSTSSSSSAPRRMSPRPRRPRWCCGATCPPNRRSWRPRCEPTPSPAILVMTISRNPPRFARPPPYVRGRLPVTVELPGTTTPRGPSSSLLRSRSVGGDRARGDGDTTRFAIPPPKAAGDRDRAVHNREGRIMADEDTAAGVVVPPVIRTPVSVGKPSGTESTRWDRSPREWCCAPPRRRCTAQARASRPSATS